MTKAIPRNFVPVGIDYRQYTINQSSHMKDILTGCHLVFVIDKKYGVGTHCLIRLDFLYSILKVRINETFNIPLIKSSQTGIVIFTVNYERDKKYIGWWKSQFDPFCL